MSVDGVPPDLRNEVDVDLLRRFLEEAEDGVWIIDDKGITVFANKAMAALLGVDRQERARAFAEFLSGHRC